MLMHLIHIGYNNTDMSKMPNVGRNAAVHCVNHELTDSLMETEDDNVILQVLCEVHQFHKNIGCYYALGCLKEKVMSTKQVRLWSILKVSITRNYYQWTQLDTGHARTELLK